MIIQAKHNIDILNNSTDTQVTTQNINKHALDEDNVSKKTKQLSIINAFSQPPTINQGTNVNIIYYLLKNMYLHTLN